MASEVNQVEEVFHEPITFNESFDSCDEEVKRIFENHGVEEIRNEQNVIEEVPELAKEFDDIFRFWLAPIPTAAEAPEVDLRPDGRSPGILPYREKSAMARNLKI